MPSQYLSMVGYIWEFLILKGTHSSPAFSMVIQQGNITSYLTSILCEGVTEWYMVSPSGTRSYQHWTIYVFTIVNSWFLATVTLVVSERISFCNIQLFCISIIECLQLSSMWSSVPENCHCKHYHHRHRHHHYYYHCVICRRIVFIVCFVCCVWRI